MLRWQFVALTLLHFFYDILSTLWTFVCAVLTSRTRTPKPLLYPRAQQPQHLAIAFLAGSNSDDEYVGSTGDELTKCILESAKLAVQWSASIGVQTLTLYDRHHILKDYSSELEQGLSLPTLPRRQAAALPARPNLRRRGKIVTTTPYLTPPATDDYASSASYLEDDVSSELDSDLTITPDNSPNGSSVFSFNFLAPSFCRTSPEDSSDDETIAKGSNIRKTSRTGMKIYVISSSDGTPAIMRAAKTLASRAGNSEEGGAREQFSIPDLDRLVTAEFPPPQFLIVHDVTPVPFFSSAEPSLQLDAFPPWHLRLTELHRTRIWNNSSWSLILRQCQHYNVLSQAAFRHALDEYEKAEMREGK